MSKPKVIEVSRKTLLKWSVANPDACVEILQREEYQADTSPLDIGEYLRLLTALKRCYGVVKGPILGHMWAVGNPAVPAKLQLTR